LEHSAFDYSPCSFFTASIRPRHWMEMLADPPFAEAGAISGFPRQAYWRQLASNTPNKT
jgi:hypothetical protein